MYKVFINDKSICFTNKFENCNQFFNRLVLNFFMSNITPFIVDLLYKSDKIEAVIIFVDDYENAFKEFQASFKIIKAAGGVVNNNKGEKLFIYRLGKWDLPKGKIESGEEIEDTAIREVEEECGIKGLTVIDRLDDTFHIYKLKEELVLKQTFWFNLKSDYYGELTPQINEGITAVKWLSIEEIEDKVLSNTYNSIKELLIANCY